jgi:ATP-dependent Clp protease ATP-binding subunit ClpC
MITKLFEDESVDLDKFISSDIITELKKYFRAEFLNRFDAILVFKPLGVSELLEIAKLEIEKIEKRMQREVRFGVDVEKLRPEIIKRADLGLGARPVKRLIEETCESLVAEFLMNKH